ncbi:MAG: hypothetical protein Q8N88_03490 [Nanoarchaeota archaeon]|nr:hypothetical protein [Nanoarchaeota archaeon]
MPSKNKAKRFDRNHSWRVARRKKQMKEWISPSKRSRKKREKKKKTD